MRYEFKTTDGEIFVVDTVDLFWGRASSILSAPTLAAAEHNLAQRELIEKGDLVPMGAGRYSFDGRTPDTKGAGDGLSTIGILSVPFEQKLVLYLVPNAEVEEDSFKANFPADMQQHVVYKIQQPQPKQQPSQINTAPVPPSKPVEGDVVDDSL